MKRNVLLTLLLIILLLVFIYNRVDFENSVPKTSVEEITYEISEDDYIHAISLSEGIPYESAKSQFNANRESRLDDSQGSYSYIAVETIYSSSKRPNYSATIVGNYEIYSFEGSKQITDCTIYSKGSSSDPRTAWIQTTVADATEYPTTVANISVTGYFRVPKIWKTEASEPINLGQKFDIESQ